MADILLLFVLCVSGECRFVVDCSLVVDFVIVESSMMFFFEVQVVDL